MDGMTSLFAAVAGRHLDVVQLLLSHGATPEARLLSSGVTLMQNALSGQAGVSMQLLELLIVKGGGAVDRR